jgi:hypothetical protein
VGLVGKTYLDLPTAIADCAKLQKSRDKAKAIRKAKSEARLDAWREANKEMLGAEAKAKAERQAQLEADNAKSKYLQGSVGERVSFVGEVKKAMTFDSNYAYNSSPVKMLILEVDGNCSVKMTTSAEWAFDINEGEQVSVVATIKEFSEFRGGKQTVVKSPRLKRLEELED